MSSLTTDPLDTWIANIFNQIDVDEAIREAKELELERELSTLRAERGYDQARAVSALGHLSDSRATVSSEGAYDSGATGEDWESAAVDGQGDQNPLIIFVVL